MQRPNFICPVIDSPAISCLFVFQPSSTILEEKFLSCCHCKSSLSNQKKTNLGFLPKLEPKRLLAFVITLNRCLAQMFSQLMLRLRLNIHRPILTVVSRVLIFSFRKTTSRTYHSHLLDVLLAVAVVDLRILFVNELNFNLSFFDVLSVAFFIKTLIST